MAETSEDGLEAACVGNEKEEEEDADADAGAAEVEDEDDEGVPAGCADAVRGRERALASTCGNLSARATHVNSEKTNQQIKNNEIGVN